MRVPTPVSRDASDRVLANRFIYHFRKPKRGDIVVFRDTAGGAGAVRDRQHVREAADRPPRRDGVERDGKHLHQRQAACGAVPAREPANQVPTEGGRCRRGSTS